MRFISFFQTVCLYLLLCSFADAMEPAGEIPKTATTTAKTESTSNLEGKSRIQSLFHLCTASIPKICGHFEKECEKRFAPVRKALGLGGSLKWVYPAHLELGVKGREVIKNYVREEEIERYYYFSGQFFVKTFKRADYCDREFSYNIRVIFYTSKWKFEDLNFLYPQVIERAIQYTPAFDAGRKACLPLKELHALANQIREIENDIYATLMSLALIDCDMTENEEGYPALLQKINKALSPAARLKAYIHHQIQKHFGPSIETELTSLIDLRAGYKPGTSELFFTHQSWPGLDISTILQNKPAPEFEAVIAKARLAAEADSSDIEDRIAHQKAHQKAFPITEKVKESASKKRNTQDISNWLHIRLVDFFDAAKEMHEQLKNKLGKTDYIPSEEFLAWKEKFEEERKARQVLWEENRKKRREAIIALNKERDETEEYKDIKRLRDLHKRYSEVKEEISEIRTYLGIRYYSWGKCEADRKRDELAKEIERHRYDYFNNHQLKIEALRKELAEHDALTEAKKNQLNLLELEQDKVAKEIQLLRDEALIQSYELSLNYITLKQEIHGMYPISWSAFR